MASVSRKISEVLSMKKYEANNFSDLSLLSILLSRPVRMIAALAVTMTAAYLLGK